MPYLPLLAFVALVRLCFGASVLLLPAHAYTLALFDRDRVPVMMVHIKRRSDSTVTELDIVLHNRAKRLVLQLCMWGQLGNAMAEASRTWLSISFYSLAV